MRPTENNFDDKIVSHLVTVSRHILDGFDDLVKSVGYISWVFGELTFQKGLYHWKHSAAERLKAPAVAAGETSGWKAYIIKYLFHPRYPSRFFAMGSGLKHSDIHNALDRYGAASK